VYHPQPERACDVTERADEFVHAAATQICLPSRAVIALITKVTYVARTEDRAGNGQPVLRDPRRLAPRSSNVPPTLGVLDEPQHPLAFGTLVAVHRS
jgi:hypothetical protein